MKKLKFWDWVSTIIFLLGAVISYIGAINETGLSALLCLGGLLIIVAALAVALIKLRCPFCRHFLGVLYSGKKTFCPYCGCKSTMNKTKDNIKPTLHRRAQGG